MKKNKTLLILLLALVVLVGGASVLYTKLSAGQMSGGNLAAQGGTEASPQPSGTEASPQPSGTETQEPVKIEAPDFTVLDADGESVKLSDFEGKPVVINFWASWCGPCKSEMPDFDEAWSRLGEEIHFLMVNMTDGSRETVESAKAYVEEQGFSFPVYFDTEYEAAIAYGASSLPTTFFIDAEGYAIAQAVGAIDADTLQRGIDMIYSGDETPAE